MTTHSNVCSCASCPGAECTCGCQNQATQAANSCQCGDTCKCGESCTCSGCQHASPRRAESR